MKNLQRIESLNKRHARVVDYLASQHDVEKRKRATRLITNLYHTILIIKSHHDPRRIQTTS